MLDNILALAVMAVIPVNVSVLLHFLFRSAIFEKVGFWHKQIIAGIIFGGIAILGTERGVLVNGAILNARDAAPLCAGLIFGAPAGIISGFIGGIERWFSVYWGVQTYTRLACTISTCFAGLYGALLKKYVFDNKIPAWTYSLAIAGSAEVLHMLSVFLTHLNDVKYAFVVIRGLSIPMILVNSVSVALAVLAINILDRENLYGTANSKMISLSVTIQRRLFLLVAISFFVTSAFTVVLQNNISETDTKEVLELNIRDAINDIQQSSDQNLLRLTRIIANRINNATELNKGLLDDMCKEFNVAEINIIDDYGYIMCSTDPDFINYYMRSNIHYPEFQGLDDDSVSEVVLPYRESSVYKGIFRKYACKNLIKEGLGYVQVGYDGEQFKTDLDLEIGLIALNRHVGENGGLVITDTSQNIVSDSSGNVGKFEIPEELFYSKDFEEYKVYEYNYLGQDVYYMFSVTEGYVVYSYIPVEEADFSKFLSIYINTFSEIAVFAGLFIFTYFLAKRIVINHIHGINNSLEEITNGNLDIIIDDNSNEEFSELSTGINNTVASLKNYIAEANSRIDTELQYAKEIQQSALPSIFPPFPYISEFEIFASMNAAKEVGGDFYDFYLIRRHILAFLVADVSGKGIPGALFMMRAKTTLKTYAEGDIAVADIFTNANFSLCEGNDAGMFVTAWMGFLDIRTGELKYANAGHNPPLIRRKGGNYEYLFSKPAFVLAGMEGVVYQESSIQLEPGDEIFLYTDGVTEATDINSELFGEDRLRKSANKYKGLSCDLICKGIKKDVEEFVGEAPQFDDITMLSVKFIKYEEKENKN